jgi:hypothetical protein
VEQDSQFMRGLLLCLALVWGWVLVCFGPLLAGKLPQFLDVSSRWLHVASAGFIASGAFIVAYFASGCFPRANWKLRFACELIPLSWLGFALFGGLF